MDCVSVWMSKVPNSAPTNRFYATPCITTTSWMKLSIRQLQRLLKRCCDRAKIPIRYKQDSIKSNRFFKKWKSITNNTGRQTSNRQDKKGVFKSTLGNLFDISHSNALERILIEEDRKFLITQREPGSREAMTLLDVALKMKESTKSSREE